MRARRRKRKVRRRWGIEMRSVREPWGGALGHSWMDHEASVRLPVYVDCWPAAFQTRHEARAMARELTEKYAYLDQQTHGWRFRPIELAITVREIRK